MEVPVLTWDGIELKRGIQYTCTQGRNQEGLGTPLKILTRTLAAVQKFGCSDPGHAPHSLHLCFLSKILPSIEAQSLNKNDICYTFNFTTMAIETDENEKLSWQRHKFSSVFNCFHAFKSFVSHFVYVSCITYENFLPELCWLKFQMEVRKIKNLTKIKGSKWHLHAVVDKTWIRIKAKLASIQVLSSVWKLF